MKKIFWPLLFLLAGPALAGTVGTIPKFRTSSAITDSAITESTPTATVTVGANLVSTGTFTLPLLSSNTVPYLGAGGVFLSTANLSFFPDTGDPYAVGNSLEVGGHGGAHGGEFVAYGQGGVALASFYADDTYGAAHIVSNSAGFGTIFEEGQYGRVTLSSGTPEVYYDHFVAEISTEGGRVKLNDMAGATTIRMTGIDGTIRASYVELGGSTEGYQVLKDENGTTRMILYTVGGDESEISLYDDPGFSAPGHVVIQNNGIFMTTTTTSVVPADPTYAQIFSTGAASAEMWVMDGAGNATQISPHNPETGRWRFLSCNDKTGRCYEVPDMERLINVVEKLSGETLHREWGR